MIEALVAAKWVVFGLGVALGGAAVGYFGLQLRRSQRALRGASPEQRMELEQAVGGWRYLMRITAIVSAVFIVLALLAPYMR